MAEQFASQFHVSLPILVDTMDDRAERAYPAWPDRVYVIDKDGRIAYKGGPGPGGFSIPAAQSALDGVLGGSQPVSAPQVTSSGGSDLPPMLRDRLTLLLDRAGVEQGVRDRALRIAIDKLQAFRDVVRARRALLEVSAEQDAGKALAAYRDAQQRYTAAAQQADRDLSGDSRARWQGAPSSATHGHGAAGRFVRGSDGGRHGIRPHGAACCPLDSRPRACIGLLPQRQIWYTKLYYLTHETSP